MERDRGPIWRRVRHGEDAQASVSGKPLASSDFFPTEDIEYGSGRILTDDDPETKVICTVQVVALNSSDEPNAMTKLHLFDSEGNLIGPNPGPGPGPSPSSGGIFMPIIFKNS